MSKLLSSNHFVVLNHVLRNGLSVELKALVNSGANRSIFINTSCARDVAKYFQTSVMPLNSDCCIWDYDGQTEEQITHTIILHLAVDGCQQADVPMLIANLGHHDMILGRKWCEEQDVWLDVRNRCLIWPDQHPELNELMAAGDEANTQQQVPDTGPARYQLPQTAAMDRYLDLAKMNQAL